MQKASAIVSERCRMCRGREDVRPVQPLERGDGGNGVRQYGKLIALCFPCRRRSRRGWKWPSAEAEKEGKRAADVRRKAKP